MNRPLYDLMQRHGLKARDVALMLDYSSPDIVTQAVSREKAKADGKPNGRVVSPRVLELLTLKLGT